MDHRIKDNLTRGSTWVRGLYMLLFVVLYSIAEIVLAAVVVFQFVYVLTTGEAQARVLAFGRDLAMYLYQILRYLAYVSDVQPFPFSPWPADAGASTDHPHGPD